MVTGSVMQGGEGGVWCVRGYDEPIGSLPEPPSHPSVSDMNMRELMVLAIDARGERSMCGIRSIGDGSIG